MEKYKFNDNTLIHTVDFNPCKIESILKYGILSSNEASKLNIDYARNYFGYNFNDYISMTRPMYSSIDDENSCYNKYITKGISFIVNDVDFIYDMNDAYYNHADEVFVKDKIDTSKFEGIIIPNEYLDYSLSDLPMIPIKSTSYENIKTSCDILIKYLENMGNSINMDEYNIYLRDLLLTMVELNKDVNNQELQDDFIDSKLALNEFIAINVENTFSKVLNKEDVNVSDMMNYINTKTLNLPIYDVFSLSKSI